VTFYFSIFKDYILLTPAGSFVKEPLSETKGDPKASTSENEIFDCILLIFLAAGLLLSMVVTLASIVFETS
jgi:hypothetical protein